ncbi:MAG: CoA-binding protein [Promethearchaeia archaeon]
MDAFFYPESIVLFGARRDSRKGGNHVLRNILNYKKENVYIIHPKHKKIHGIPCFKSIFDIKQKSIDLGIIILPIPYVLDALEDCLEFGIKNIILESGALYLKGENDKKNEQRIRRIKEKLEKDKNIKIMGPNSIGIYCAHKNGHNFITSLIYFEKLPKLKQKNLTVISQTGLTLSGLLSAQNYIQEIGFSKIAAIGNKFGVNETDVLEYLENDAQTDVIAMYLEDIKEGGKFRTMCSRILKTKPIILLKSGKTEKGKKAIISHTNSLAGNYKIIEGLAKQLGFILVDDFYEMFAVAKMLLSQPAPQGNKIGVISISGAGTVITADMSKKYGLKLPDLTDKQFKQLKTIFPEWAWEDVYNPLDIWASVEYVGPDKAYGFAGDVLMKGNIDILLYLITGIEETKFDWHLLMNLNKKHPEIPIYMGFFGGGKKLLLKWREELVENCNIPTFPSLNIIFKSISRILHTSK